MLNALLDMFVKPAYASADPVAVAAKKGVAIVEPGPNELQLDIDSDAAYARFIEGLHLLMQLDVKVSYKVTPSKTEGHKHITVTLDIPIESAIERIALQAILGSDLRRELYSWQRVRTAAHLPTVFFEPKNA